MSGRRARSHWCSVCTQLAPHRLRSSQKEGARKGGHALAFKDTVQKLHTEPPARTWSRDWVSPLGSAVLTSSHVPIRSQRSPTTGDGSSQDPRARRSPGAQSITKPAMKGERASCLLYVGKEGSSRGPGGLRGTTYVRFLRCMIVSNIAAGGNTPGLSPSV